MRGFTAAARASPSRLEKLTLDGCSFDNHAAEQFLRCMPLQSPGGLRELRFSGRQPKLGDGSFGRSVALLMMDSSVRALGFGSTSETDMQDFLETVARQPFRVRIEHLRFPFKRRGYAVWHTVVECIPCLLYVKQLDIGPVPNWSAALLLDSMRQNGSWLSLYHEWNYRPFNSYDLARLHAYRKRNKCLPIFLETPCRASRKEDRRLSLLPTLFTVAGHTGKLCAKFILSGLFSSGCSIGPDKGSKRRRQQLSVLKVYSVCGNKVERVRPQGSLERGERA
jgi:hypothetical protein